MKNDTKLDIQLENQVSEDMSAIQKAEKYYEIAHRYLEISRMMNKYEEHDKYMHRGIRYMKKCHPYINVKKELRALRFELFAYRAQGRIDLYEEAMSILNSAKNERDYALAYEIFKRIHNHELKHSVPEKYTDPEVYARFIECSDSEQRMQYCEEKIAAIRAEDKRKTKMVSGLILVVLIAALCFSKTLTFHKVLGDVFSTVGAYSFAYQQYEHVYGNTKDTSEQEKLLDRSSECHYAAAQKALDANNNGLAFHEYSICAARDYKDSSQKLYQLELEKIANAEIGSYIRYGANAKCLWKVLKKDGNKVLLYKKYGLDDKPKPPFHEVDEAVTWETCSLRKWLNTVYFDREFSEIEKSSILETNVPADDNTTYNVSAGNDTVDKIYMLSATEYHEFEDLLPETEASWWLRTPGAHPNSASFVDRYKNVMSYGYDVTNQHFTIKPVLWVQYK